MKEGMENRRREDRHAVNTIVTINEQMAMVKDLSLSGMRVTAMNLKPQQLVDLTLKSGASDINIKALVRWVRRTFPFESYSECGLALISAPDDYHDLYEKITVPPHFFPLFGFWPISLVLFGLALALMLWV